MNEEISQRLLDQRVRNRIIQATEILADGECAFKYIGVSGYFNWFYDHVPHREDGGMRPNSAMTQQEWSAGDEVSRLVDEACDTTHRNISDTEFIATGWPARIQPTAKRALAIMLERGQFSEEKEEAEPSNTG